MKSTSCWTLTEVFWEWGQCEKADKIVVANDLSTEEEKN